MYTMTIVIQGGVVQNVYANHPRLRVTVLDFDTEGAPPSVVLPGGAIGTDCLASPFDTLPPNARTALAALIAPKALEALVDPDFIAIPWCVEDVQEIRPDLSPAQCQKVLCVVEHRHDATIGVNWEVLACFADDLFPESDDGDRASWQAR